MKRSLITALITLWLFSAVYAQTIKVIATTTDLKSIAEYIGGDKITVTSIIPATQNPHSAEAKNSFNIDFASVNVFITTGLDLEPESLSALIAASHNKKIQKGAAGYVDASKGIDLLQVPAASSDKKGGGIHIYGNPHYWLNPLNGKQIARDICNGLEKISPDNKSFFEANLIKFDDTIDTKMKEWKEKMAAFNGTKVIAYHNEWVYFDTCFGLKNIDFIEPQTGVPPTPTQLVKVIREVKSNQIKVIMSAPYFTTSSIKVVEQQAGAKIITLATSVGAFDSIKNYFDLFDYDINLLSQALK